MGSMNSTLTSLTTPTTFTGYIVGTTLTVVTITGTLTLGQVLTGTGVTTNTVVNTQLTGTTGKSGTYTISLSQTVGTLALPSALTATAPASATSLANTISSTLSSIQAAVTNMITGLTTSLPLMAAADNLEKKLKISQGITPASGAGTNFAAAFSPMTSIGSTMGSLQSVISANAAGVAAGSAPAIAAMQLAHDNANAAQAASFASAAAAKADSIGNLKAFAFTQYTAMPKPPHVQDIINQAVPTPPDTSGIKLDTKVSASVLKNSYTPTSLDSPKPVTDSLPNTVSPAAEIPSPHTMCGIGAPAFRNSYVDMLSALKIQINSAESTYKLRLADVEYYKTTTWVSPTYATIKSNGGPEYDTAKSTLHTYTGWDTYMAAIQDYNSKVAEYSRRMEQYDRWAAAPGGLAANAICDPTKW